MQHTAIDTVSAVALNSVASVALVAAIDPGPAGILVDRKTLSAVLVAALSVIERRNTIPILGNVRMTVAGDVLTVRGTDLDIEFYATISGQARGEFDITTPAHMLSDFVRKAKSDTIKLELAADDDTLVIKAGGSNHLRVHTLPSIDFPSREIGPLNTSFIMPMTDLTGALDRVGFAVSTEETRYYLNGVFMRHLAPRHAGGANGTLQFTATDGHRLARVNLASPVIENAVGGMPGVIIPRKAVAAVLKSFGGKRKKSGAGSDTFALVSVSVANIVVESDNIRITSKVVDGTFPDADRVIPAHNDRVLTIEADMLAEAVDRVTTIASERGRAVKLMIEDGNVRLLVKNPDAGDSSATVEAEYSAPPMEIGFNGRYLVDILKQLKGAVVEILLADPGSPVLIRDRAANANALFVLMPMRV